MSNLEGRPFLSAGSLDTSASAWVRRRMTSRAGMIAALRGQLQETQWLAQREQDARQSIQVSQLLQHCERYSPWFRARLHELRLSLRDISSVDGLRRLPILTKADIQDAGASFFCEKVPSSHGYRMLVKTSGSTGEPTSLYRTLLNDIDWMAVALRDDDWHSRDYLGRQCAIRLHSNEAVSLPTWTAPVNMLFESGPSLLLPLSWDIPRLDAAIRDFKPTHLQLFPSLLLGLVKGLNGDFRGYTELREIQVFGEVISPEAKRLAVEELRVPVIDTYSSEEFGKIACQCPQTELFHINSELLIVEILDDHDCPCSPGETGRVIVTDLRNFASPVVRYDIGDFAEVGPPCSCGRQLPTLTRIIGRHRNLMRLRDGRRRLPRLGYLFREFGKHMAVRQFQVIQTEFDLLEIRLLTDEIGTPAKEAIFGQLVTQLTNQNFRLRFHYFSDHLPKGSSTKFEDFISLLPDD